MKSVSNGNRTGFARRFAAAAVAASALLAAGYSASADVVSPDDVKVTEDLQVTESLTGQPGDPAEGRKVFSDRKTGNCLACHANKDLADLPFHGQIGPAMDGVADRYEPGTLRAIVVNSKQVFGGQTIMPSFYRLVNGERTAEQFQGKSILTAQQVEDVIAYLQTLKE